jgi:plasmid stabilization system protein ParE
MSEYRLSPKAIADLEDIYAAGLEQFGPAPAPAISTNCTAAFSFSPSFPVSPAGR